MLNPTISVTTATSGTSTSTFNMNWNLTGSTVHGGSVPSVPVPATCVSAEAHETVVVTGVNEEVVGTVASTNLVSDLKEEIKELRLRLSKTRDELTDTRSQRIANRLETEKVMRRLKEEGDVLCAENLELTKQLAVFRDSVRASVGEDTSGMQRVSGRVSRRKRKDACDSDLSCVDAMAPVTRGTQLESAVSDALKGAGLSQLQLSVLSTVTVLTQTVADWSNCHLDSTDKVDCKSEEGFSASDSESKKTLLHSLDAALRLLRKLYPTKETIDALNANDSAELSEVQKKLLETKQKSLASLISALVKLETELKIQGILGSGLYLRREGWRRHRELADEYLSPWRVLVTDAHMCRTLSRVGDRLPVDGSAQPSAESLSIVSIPAFILQQIDGKLKAATRKTGEKLPQPQFFLYSAYSQLSRFPEFFAKGRVEAVSYRNAHCPQLLQQQMDSCLSQLLACSTPVSECPPMQSVALHKDSDEFVDTKGVSEMRSDAPLLVSRSKHNSIGGIVANGAGAPVSYAPVVNVHSLRNLNVTLGNAFHGNASVASHRESNTTLKFATASGSVDKAAIDARVDSYQTKAEVIARLKLLNDTISKGLLFAADLVTERFDATTDTKPLAYLQSLFDREFSMAEKKKIHNSSNRTKFGNKNVERMKTIRKLFRMEKKLRKKKKATKKKEEKKKKKRKGKKEKKRKAKKKKKKKRTMSDDTLVQSETSQATGLRQRGRRRKRSKLMAAETDTESAATLQTPAKKRQKRANATGKKRR